MSVYPTTAERDATVATAGCPRRTALEDEHIVVYDYFRHQQRFSSYVETLLKLKVDSGEKLTK
jgi:hypothetical protein